MARKNASVVLAHITTVPWSFYFLSGQPRYMRERGLEVHAISSPGRELGVFAAQEGANVHAVTMERRITPLRDVAALFRLIRIMRRVRPTIVHAHTPKGGMLGVVAGRMVKAPVVIYHMRGLPLMTATGTQRHLLRWTEWISCHVADQVICVSSSLRDVAIAEGLCPPEKILVLGCGSGNGVDATHKFDPATGAGNVRKQVRNELGIPEDATVIGFMGRLARDKGIVELTEAFHALRASWSNLHVIVAGPFEHRDPVSADTVKLMRSDPQIHVVGEIQDTPAYYAAMDLFVLPTYREGFPNVLLEAAAMELPVVATRIPGCIDAVNDGTTGTLVPVQDSSSLAVAIDAYLRDPELRRRHGNAGRQRVLREFQRERIWEAIYDLYVRLLEQKRVSIPERSSNHCDCSC